MNDNPTSPFNFSHFDSVLGPIFVVGTSHGVSNVMFGKDRFERFLSRLGGIRLAEGRGVEESAGQIKLYLEGKLKEFQTELDLSSGTPFQISVWNELLRIPYGNTSTYSEIAERIGSPLAARAVGNAVGANPVPIIVPCHRVVAVNGLGGYSCGVEIKKRLLQIEGVLS